MVEEMIVNDINYDIDNVDLEEQMLIQDLEEEAQEEQNIEDQKEKVEEEKAQEESRKQYFESRRTINTRNLDLDLDLEVEDLRPVYQWESLKDGQIYKGCVVHKFDNNTYIFNASVKGKNDFKLKKFTLDNIKQIKK